MKIVKIITGYALLDLLLKKESKMSKLIIWVLLVGILLHLFNAQIFSILTLELEQFSSFYTDKPLFIVTDIFIVLTLLLYQGLSLLLGIVNIEIPLGLLEDIMQLTIIFNNSIVNVLIKLPYFGVGILNFSWIYLYLGLFLYVVLIIVRSVFNIAIKAAIVVTIVLIIFNFTNQMFMMNKYDDKKYLSKDYYESANIKEVEYVDTVDGDTIKLMVDGKKESVRLLYVDTPESTKTKEPYGYEATQFTKMILERADEIVIEYDGERYDKYGRLLAWVWVDGVLLQEALTKNGFTKKFYDYGTYKYEEILNISLEYAKRQKEGIYE